MTHWQPVPTNNAPQLEDMFKSLYGKDRRLVILNRECMSCDKQDIAQTDFVDDQSITEYHISGLCQQCQDSTFA